MIAGNFSRTTITAAVLAVLCTICYWNSINTPFLFDDIPNIVDNAAVHVDNLNLENLYSAGVDSLTTSRPLANISFALNYYLDGLDVTPYHLVNILIHFINGLLVYFLALFIFRRTAAAGQPGEASQAAAPIFYMALFAAALFIVHPLQIQSVTYIVQRMNSMAAMFYLLALLLYIRARTTGRNGQRIILFGATAAAWLLALGCKETAATLPAAILLLEWYFFQDADWGFFRRHMAALACLFVLMLGVAWYFLGAHPLTRITHPYHFRDFSLVERLLTESRVVVLYISLLILPLPSRLNLLHGISISHSFLTPPTTLLCQLLLLGLFVLAVVSARRHRLLSFCILWFLLQLAIESSFIGLELVFEHRLYMPMVGFSLATGYLLFRLLTAWPRALAVCSILIITAFSAGTVVRNTTWASADTMWNDVIKKNPGSYRAYYNLANDYAGRNLYEKAIPYYRKAIAMRPNYAQVHNNLGIALMKLGMMEQAIMQFDRATRLDPRNYRSNYNMAIAQNAAGNTERAITEYRAALGKNPNYAQAQYNLGNLFDRTGDMEQAEYYYREAIRSDPGHAMANNNLAILLAKQGKYEEAVTSVKKVIELQPGFYGGYINLGNLYISMNKQEQACPQFRKALQINPDTDQIPEKIKQACNLAK